MHKVGWLAAILVAACGCLATTPARADFAAALAAYQAGRLDDARREFLELAALGDAVSQVNLAAIHRRGEGVPPDVGAAAGWLQAAFENGYRQVSHAKIESLRSSLTADQRRAADEVVAHYGRAALRRSVLPRRELLTCSVSAPIRTKKFVRPEFPYAERNRELGTFVVVDFRLDADGHARDVEVIFAPVPVFVERSLDALLRTEFIVDPAQRQDGTSWLRIRYGYSAEAYMANWDGKLLDQLRVASENEEPQSQYVYGLVQMIDGTAGNPVSGFELVLKAAQGGVAEAQRDVARRLMNTLNPCAEPAKAVRWLEAAVKGGSAAAAVDLLGMLDAEAPTRSDPARVKALLEAGARSTEMGNLRRVVEFAAGLHSPALRDPELAARVAARLVDPAGDIDPDFPAARAAAAAANGRFEEASTHQARAIAMATALGRDTTRARIALDAYRAGRTP